MVIFKGKTHQQGWYQDYAVAKDWVFATSPNGWTDDDLALDWLQDCFDKHTKQKAQGKFHLLILNGHGSHVTANFIQQAWDSCIVCLCLPPIGRPLRQLFVCFLKRCQHLQRQQKQSSLLCSCSNLLCNKRNYGSSKRSCRPRSASPNISSMHGLTSLESVWTNSSINTSLTKLGFKS